MSKKKKSHKHKSKKKKDRKRDRSSSRSTRSSTSRSSSRSTSRSTSPKAKATKSQTYDSHKQTYGNQSKNWTLSQRSESLMHDDPLEQQQIQSTFIWRKRNEKLGVDKLDEEEVQILNKQKQLEAKKELEKLKKRKEEREREREEREREREFLQRQKEADYHKEWEKQEDSFHLQQVKLRSKIRIEEGRAKPIDLLAKYIDDEESDLVVDLHEPYTYLNGLTIRDLEDLLVDIKVYSKLDKKENFEYWSDLTIITEDELKKLQRLDPNYADQTRDRREGVNQSVLTDISSLFKGKTYEQLVTLEETINAKIQSKDVVDVGYWESVLSQLKAHMARARLRERHQKVLVDRLQNLKKQQGIISEIPRETEKSETFLKPQVPAEQIEEENMDSFEDGVEDYDMKYEPILLRVEQLSFDTFIVTQEEDEKRLEFKRLQVKGSGTVNDTEDEFEKKARDSMNGSQEGDDNNKFNEEISLQQNYLWADKYRPRKPRYYNRVHTGYDWNQYNKKHYDTDNPPPKTVQGYKFNIFYPDLIDKTKTPSYSITVCQDNPDFAILRFKAGPPYEDVAFKIVNREWDISHRHGFRCQFQNGIFQLWFHFRKWKYRR